METIFETERLIVRRWEPEQDLDDAYEMYNDPEVMRYLGSGGTFKEVTREEQLARLKERVAVDLERNNGTGFWAIEDRERKRVVGAVIVKRLPDGDGNPTPETEVGWHLKRAEWGKGYATEAARGAVGYAFQTLGLPVIHAVVYKENTRSIAVTQRLGMTPLGPTDKYYGVTVELFELRRP